MACDAREPAADQPGIDADGRLTVSVPCRTCRYDLRTLRTDGLCPECGRSVRESLDAHDLLLADAARLRGMLRWLSVSASAVGLIAVFAAAVLASEATVLALLIDDNVTHLIPLTERAFWGTLSVAFGLLLLGGLVGLVGLIPLCVSLVLLTRARGDPLLGPSAIAARMCLFVNLPLIVVAVVLAVGGRWDVRFVAILALVALLSDCLRVVADTAERLCLALGERKRKVLGWLRTQYLSFLAAVILVFAAYTALVSWMPFLPPSRWGGFVNVAVALLAMVACVVVIRLALNLRRLRAAVRRLHDTRLPHGATDA